MATRHRWALTVAIATLLLPETAHAISGSTGAGLGYFFIAMILPPVLLPLALQLVVGLKIVPRYHHKLLTWFVLLAVPVAVVCSWLGWGLLTLVAPTLPLAAVLLYEKRHQPAIVALLATWGAGVGIWYASMFIIGTLGLFGMAVVWGLVLVAIVAVLRIARKTL
jgi:hypothetical protein